MSRSVLTIMLALVPATAFAQPRLDLPPRYSLERLGAPPTGAVDGPVADAQVGAVGAMAFAPDGSLYFSDGTTIRRVVNGVVTTVAGAEGRTGTEDGPALQARFSQIQGLAVTADGTVLIADTGNHTIRRLTTDGQVSTWLGVPGASGFANGRGAAARFWAPQGIAVDASGTVYVVDRNCSLRRVTPAGDVQLMVMVTGECWTPSAFAFRPDIYWGPVAVAVDAGGTVFVAKQWRGVVRVTPGGEQTVLANDRERHFRALTVLTDGRVRALEAFVYDSRFGNNASLFGQNAVLDIASDDTVSTLATLDPRTGGVGVGMAGLTVGTDGTTYVGNTEQRRIDSIAPAGTVTPWMGTAARPATVSRSAPGSDGSLLIAEEASSVRQVRRLESDGTRGAVLYTPSVLPGSIVRSGTDFYLAEGNTVRRMTPAGAVSVVTTFSAAGESLNQLAAAPDGTLVAWLSTTSPSAWRLARVTTEGLVSTIATGADVLRGITVSPVDGAIFYSGDRVLLRRDPAGTTTTVAGDAAAPAATVDGASGQARLVYPTQLRALADGSVLFLDGVADASNTWSDRVVRRVDAAGTVTSLWSGTSSLGALEVSSTGDWYVVADGAVHRLVAATAAPLVITAQPQSVTAQAGASAVFTVEASGGPSPLVLWQQSTDGGGTWTTLRDAAGQNLTGTRLTRYAVTRTMQGYQYRAALADADEFLVSQSATLSVIGMEVSPGSLRFAATRDGTTGALVHATPTQPLAVSFTTGAPAWTAAASVSWLSVSADSAGGAGRVYVSLVNPGDVIGTQTSLVGAVTISPTDTSLPAITIPVSLAVSAASSGSTTAPVGQVDTPAQGATGLQGAVAMTGWVVDDVGVHHVRVYRQCFNFDSVSVCQPVAGVNMVLLGEASVIPGARPDVEAAYPALPANNAAGWGFLILSNLLPNVPAGLAGGGVGTFSLYAVATDVEGNQTVLGRSIADQAPTGITVANDTIAKPFGAIDTPGQGATVSGTLNNFGWALTPDPGAGVLVPIDGSTISVFVDGVAVGTATYNLCRGSVAVDGVTPTGVLCDDDVSSIFRNAGSFRNLDAGRGAIGLRTIDTTTLSNGLHTIQWGVTDSASRSEGIGSRYFTVLNSAADVGGGGWRPVAAGDAAGGFVARRDLPRRQDVAIFGRTGFNLDRAFVPVEPINGVPSVVVPEVGRVELQIPGARGVSLLANGEVRDGPVGMAVSDDDMVTWSVGPGYLGTYRLLVEREDDHVVVDVTVTPMALVEEPVRMHLDAASTHCPIASLPQCLISVSGWALDPQAETGSGIGAVHVWARKKTSGVFSASDATEKTPDVFFLGIADLGVARPDVAAAHGARFPYAGFSFQRVLGEGEWEVTAYIWNIRTQRFEDARSATVIVR
jgi:hypothetical protein